VASEPDSPRTLAPAHYIDPRSFERQRERVFQHAWHMFPRGGGPLSGTVYPWDLALGGAEEPLLLTRDAQGALHCMSNVCTHRASILVERPMKATSLRCPYHGRRFGLDGAVLSAPGFECLEGFPAASDALPTVPLRTWHHFVFASLAPALRFEDWIAPVEQRVGALFEQPMRHSPEHDRTFEVGAHWALYIDNYLEGLHIPFAHPSLNRALDFSEYHIELLPHGVLQRATAAGSSVHFDWPTSHPDHGQRIAAYYYWLFPNTMFNVYPWGVSINLVLPVGPSASRVIFLRYVWDEATHDSGAGSGLDQVEHEDEAIIARCQRGIRASLYRPGHYAPRHEDGVQQFHRLLCAAMDEPSP